MLDFSRVQNYYIACGYTDMRKQIDGLAALVQTQFGQEMDETSLYLFCGRRADRIKALELSKKDLATNCQESFELETFHRVRVFASERR